MSVSSLADSSALRLTTAKETAVARGAAEAHAPKKSLTVQPSEPLTQLVNFIPTETITIYIAIQTALGEVKMPATKGARICQASFDSRWYWLLGIAILTAALTLCLSYRKQKQVDSAAEFKVPLVEIGAAVAGFVVWALALPGTPLRDFCGYDASSWSPVILLLGTLAIATVLNVSGKNVSWTKVLN